MSDSELEHVEVVRDGRGHGRVRTEDKERSDGNKVGVVGVGNL
jgi:hypothetical protein